MSGNGAQANSTMGSASALNRLGLSYGIVISVGTMVVLTAILLASYLCIRLRVTLTLTIPSSAGASAAPPADGIDEATLDSYPKMIYAALASKSDPDRDCCSICLTDYVDSDMIRLMPECAHMFHVACIDVWLRTHPTCPVCRGASPLTSPLSQFIPLARNDSLRRT